MRAKIAERMNDLRRMDTHRLRRKYEIMILDEEMTSMLLIVVLSIILLSPRKTRLGEMDSSFDTFIMEWHRGG